mgnify:CR=1 FL=1
MFWRNKTRLPETLNICIIARYFPILGRAADHGFLWPIAKGLAKAGHKVTVISWKNPQGKDLIEKDGVSAHFIGNKETSDLRINDLFNAKFKALHTENPFHIAHCIDRHGIAVARRRKAYKVAVAFDSDATDMSQLFAIMGMAQDSVSDLVRTGIAMVYKFAATYLRGDRKVLNSADGVFVTSPQQRVVLERYYMYPELKTYIVPYGIEIGDLAEREKSSELRESLKVPGNSPVVMTFTDMSELEDVLNILKAFEKVTIKKPSARLIIVGNGPLKRQLQYEMLQLALGSKVVFAGAIRNVDIPDYISLADVFVDLSSRTTGFEPGLIEAMAQKKVIIGSEVSPISTIVEDGQDGFLIRPADRASLAHLIIKVFTEQVSANEVGEKARKKVVELFDVDNMVEQTIDAYGRILLSTGRYRENDLVDYLKAEA